MINLKFSEIISMFIFTHVKEIIDAINDISYSKVFYKFSNTIRLQCELTYTKVINNFVLTNKLLICKKIY